MRTKNSEEKSQPAYIARANAINQNQSVAVRLAHPSDITGIMAVENSAFAEEDRYSRNKILSRLRGPPFDCAFERKYFVVDDFIGAIDRNTGSLRIIGYAEAAIQSPQVALFSNTAPVIDEIGSLDSKVGALISSGVLPSHRGIGAGSLLTSARLEYFRDHSIRQIFAHAWPNGGFPKMGARFGFRKIKDWAGAQYSDGSHQALYYLEL